MEHLGAVIIDKKYHIYIDYIYSIPCNIYRIGIRSRFFGGLFVKMFPDEFDASASIGRLDHSNTAFE